MNDELQKSGLLDERDASRFARRGHFAYEAGHHGDTLFALELLFTDPERLRRAVARLAVRLRDRRAELVCAPMIGGALVGQCLAAELGIGFVYAERAPERSPSGSRYRIPVEMRRLLDAQRAVVVDDAIDAGSATLACAREVESAGGRVVAVASLIVRESSTVTLTQRFGMQVEALLAIPWNTWPEPDCPLCKAGIEIDSTT